MLISSRPVLLRPEALARLNYGRQGISFSAPGCLYGQIRLIHRHCPLDGRLNPAPPPIPLFQRGHYTIKTPSRRSLTFPQPPSSQGHEVIVTRTAILSRICLASCRIPVRVMMTLLDMPPET